MILVIISNLLKNIVLCSIFPGEKNVAKYYLNKFSWGHSFIELNQDLLDAYASCKDGKEVIETQNKFIKKFEDEAAQRNRGKI